MKFTYFLLCLAAACVYVDAATQTTTSYSDSACTEMIGVRSQSGLSTCAAADCAKYSAGIYVKIACGTTVQTSVPDTYAKIAISDTDNCLPGTFMAALPATCFWYSAAFSAMIPCGDYDAKPPVLSVYDSQDCSGVPLQDKTYANDCTYDSNYNTYSNGTCPPPPAPPVDPPVAPVAAPVGSKTPVAKSSEAVSVIIAGSAALVAAIALF